MRKLLNLLLVVSLIFVIGCSSDDDNGNDPQPTEFELVSEVTDDYLLNTLGTNNMTAGDLVANLSGANADDYQVIDWRSSADFNAKSHIDGAINLSLGDIAEKVSDGTIRMDKTVVNVCYTGQTASYATMVLNLLGYTAYNLKFGMCGITADSSIVAGVHKWSANEGKFAGYIPSLETTANDVTALPDVGLPDLDTGEGNAADILMSQVETMTHGSWGKPMDVVWDNSDDYFIINYWPESQYSDPGHIPSAYCFEPKTALTSDGLLAKLPKDQDIAVYCYTGQTSAQLTAYLRMMGYTRAYSVLFGMNSIGPDGYLKYSVPTDPNFLSILTQ